MGRAVRGGKSLDPAVVEAAQALHEEILKGELRDVLVRMGEAAKDKEPLLVRLFIQDRALQAVPWEALCKPGTSEGFLGTNPKMLSGSFCEELRLLILEACEGAKAGMFGSAAEIFAKAGVDAVVAHLWPVKADVARTCSTEIYRSLTGAERGMGDIGASVAAARRTLLAQSAEAFSPILYLRGSESVIFNGGNAARETFFGTCRFRNREPGPNRMDGGQPSPVRPRRCPDAQPS